MDDKGKQIAYQVAFKAAVDLVANGVAEPETEDIAAEITALSDALFDQLLERLEGLGKAKSSGRSKTSRKGGSSGKSRTGRGSSGGNFKYASAKQAKFIEKLLDEKDHDLDFDDDGFDWDGETYAYDEVPSGKTQEIIGFLMDLDDA